MAKTRTQRQLAATESDWHRTLMIRNIPIDTTMPELLQFFSRAPIHMEEARLELMSPGPYEQLNAYVIIPASYVPELKEWAEGGRLWRGKKWEVEFLKEGGSHRW